MENYLRIFDTEADYESVKDGLVYPTVSYTVDTDKLWYIKRIPPIQNQVKMVFSVTKDDVDYYGGEMMRAWQCLYLFDSVTVDGVEQVNASEYDVNIGIQDGDEFKLTDESFFSRPLASLTINFNEPLNQDSNIVFAFHEKWEEDGEWVFDSWLETLDDIKERYNHSIMTTKDGRISSITIELGWEYDESYQFGISIHTYADNDDPSELILSKDNIIDINVKYTSKSFYLYLPTTEARDYEVVATRYSNVTNMNSMFSDCSSLTSLDLSSFDTSNVTYMSNMFSYCSGLTTLDLSNFDTSKVTSMRSMFYNCRGLTSLDVSNFNTSNVTDMYDMFSNCSKLTSIDLSNFDTSSVTDMSRMFMNCNSLTSVTMVNSISALTNVLDMFRFVNTIGTFYYNGNYDYSKIMAVLALNWTSVDLNGASSLYEWVDLGLPSGLKWATCNIGATKPEENGLYFAWGETQGYTAEDVYNGVKQFTWADYKWSSDANGTTMTKYNETDGLDTLEAADDAATATDSSCRIPTAYECLELIDNTTSEFVYNYNEAGEVRNGRLFTSKVNGNSIFIPAAGVCTGGLTGEGQVASLMSSSLHVPDPKYAGSLEVPESSSYLDVVSSIPRFAGFSIRPVKE